MPKTIFAAFMQITSAVMNGLQGHDHSGRDEDGACPLLPKGKNLLINGAFAINQRGYVSGTATPDPNHYTLDRWRVVVSGQNATFGASGAGNVVTCPAGGLEEVVEASAVAGGTYSLSWTGTATAKINGADIANGATAVLPANTAATVRFSGGTVSLAQLELSPYPTAFEHRLPAVELALCQRYFVGLRRLTLEVGTSSTGALQCTDRFPVPMRAAPSLVFADAVGNENKITKLIAGVATNNIAPTTGAFVTSVDGIEATFTLSGGMTGWQIKYTADAEL